MSDGNTCEKCKFLGTGNEANIFTVCKKHAPIASKTGGALFPHRYRFDVACGDFEKKENKE